ncbi:RNA polymerase sigma factor [Streptomyces sp. 6N106]|uniref:RNA polymerase sigma factor n=1 Tax=Streptomyces sp. 6N106 TaxID=3457418 RepID=UPI003FD0AD3C
MADGLGSLPRHQRQVLTLRYYADLPVRDIATLLDVPPDRLTDESGPGATGGKRSTLTPSRSSLPFRHLRNLCGSTSGHFCLTRLGTRLQPVDGHPARHEGVRGEDKPSPIVVLDPVVAR